LARGDIVSWREKMSGIDFSFCEIPISTAASSDTLQWYKQDMRVLRCGYHARLHFVRVFSFFIKVFTL
jgi:hypothetical protein